ncbi:MAG: MFS transporter [Deltaproteobacteria bacterium]|nr:MFS transporter [Deltaproteobacteria bacterium]
MDSTLPKNETNLSGVKKFFLAFMLLVIVATGFNTFLSILSYKTVYVNSLISQYTVMGNVLKKKIEFSLRFGKTIDNFFGIDDLLQNHLTHMKRLKTAQISATGSLDVFILDTQGRVRYAANKTVTKTPLPPEISKEMISRVTGTGSSQLKSFFKHDNQYYLPLSIGNWDNTLEGILVISFPERLISNTLTDLQTRSLITWAGIILIAFFMLFFVFYLVMRRNRAGKSDYQVFRNRKISYYLLCIIVLCQILFTMFQSGEFSRNYLSINQTKADALNLFMADQIEALLDKGINLINLKKAEDFLSNMIDNIPEFSSIILSDAKGYPLYFADSEMKLNYAMPEIQNFAPITGPYLRERVLMDGSQKAGSISLVISEKVIGIFLKKTILDAATILLISIFFCVEIMLLFFIGLNRKKSEPGNRFNTRIIRPVAFVYFFAIDIVVSFIPLYMKDLYFDFPLLFFSKEMSLGLPITVQMAFTAVSILIVGNWCDKKGWQQPFFFGLAFSGLGYFIAYTSASPITFLAALATAGFGYGLSYISAQNFVTTYSLPEKKAQGLSEYYAGCIAGSLCGVVTGGMLAEQIGYARVFGIGFVLMAGVFLGAFFLMKPYFAKSGKKPGKTIDPKLSLFSFFMNRQIASLVFLNLLPASILLVGFLNYFVPVYLREKGISQSDIGRIFMIYGICVIYMAPFLTKKLNAARYSISYITLAGILSSLTLLTFWVSSGYTAVVVSILFLGLGASFNAIRNAYFLNLDISKKLGEGLATSLFFFLARMGQAIGPVIFAWFAVEGDAVAGIVKIGLFFMVFSVSFWIINKGYVSKRVSV